MCIMAMNTSRNTRRNDRYLIDPLTAGVIVALRCDVVFCLYFLPSFFLWHVTQRPGNDLTNVCDGLRWRFL